MHFCAPSPLSTRSPYPLGRRGRGTITLALALWLVASTMPSKVCVCSSPSSPPRQVCFQGDWLNKYKHTVDFTNRAHWSRACVVRNTTYTTTSVSPPEETKGEPGSHLVGDPATTTTEKAQNALGPQRKVDPLHQRRIYILAVTTHSTEPQGHGPNHTFNAMQCNGGVPCAVSVIEWLLQWTGLQGAEFRSLGPMASIRCLNF